MGGRRNRDPGDGATAVPTAVRFDDILEQLHSTDERERERAARQLTRLGRVGLTPEQGLRALKASTRPSPRRRRRGDDTSVDLIRAAFAVPYPDYLPSVVQRFHLWHDRARKEVLARLVRIEDERAASALLTLLRQHARTGRVRSLPLGLYAYAPQFAEVLFPGLLEFLDVPRLRLSVVEYALSFAAAHLIDGETLRQAAGQFLAMYRQRRDKLVPAQQAEGVAWRWDLDYHRRRWQAGVLLDLLGFVPEPEALETLREALAVYTDPRLRLYAVLSLLRHNEEVDPALVAEIAGCPESRKWLFDGLQKLERFHLYPTALRTQAALAESDLVNWLLHPRELGRAPDEIELMQVVTFNSETDAGWLDYYLFRFKVGGEHWAARLGWLAGVSGPFVRKDAPTIQSLGDTHSAYRPWDDKSQDDHVSDVRQVMKSWRERHLSRDE
jgi:hypothetical protein